MHARLQTTRAMSEPPDPAGLFDTLAGHPGFAGVWMLEQIGHGRGTLVTLWHTERDAVLASERTTAAQGPRPIVLETDEVYEVDDDWPGIDGVVPTVASLVWIDGPLGQEQVEATRFAGRERINPAVAGLPGVGRTIAMWQPATRSYVILSLAAGLDELEAGHRTIMSTELLPGEDPALLPGADRVDLHRILAARVPTGAEVSA
jgi:hypothetical protein